MNQLQPTATPAAAAPDRPAIAERLRQLARQAGEIQHEAANLLFHIELRAKQQATERQAG